MNDMTDGQKYAFKRVSVNTKASMKFMSEIIKRNDLPIEVLTNDEFVFYAVKVTAPLVDTTISNVKNDGTFTRFYGSSEPLQSGQTIVVPSGTSLLVMTRGGLEVNCVSIYNDDEMKNLFRVCDEQEKEKIDERNLGIYRSGKSVKKELDEFSKRFETIVKYRDFAGYYAVTGDCEKRTLQEFLDEKKVKVQYAKPNFFSQKNIVPFVKIPVAVRIFGEDTPAEGVAFTSGDLLVNTKCCGIRRAKTEGMFKKSHILCTEDGRALVWDNDKEHSRFC